MLETLDNKIEVNKYAKVQTNYKAVRFAMMEKLARHEMYCEDLLSKYTVMREINEEEQEKHMELKDIKNEYFFLLKKDKQLKNKIIRLQPLLKEIILEIGDNNSSENTLDECINNLRKTLEDWIISEEKFRNAANYDAKQYFDFERCRRDNK